MSKYITAGNALFLLLLAKLQMQQYLPLNMQSDQR